MKLEFDADLKNFFKQYENSLKSYPISSKRRREKVAQYKAALRNLREPNSYTDTTTIKQLLKNLKKNIQIRTYG